MLWNGKEKQDESKFKKKVKQQKTCSNVIMCLKNFHKTYTEQQERTMAERLKKLLQTDLFI